MKNMAKQEIINEVKELEQINKEALDVEEEIKNLLRCFLDSIRDYEHESHNTIANDERESEEFVDIYMKEGDGNILIKDLLKEFSNSQDSKEKKGLDLNKLSKKVDGALENATTESLTKFMENRKEHPQSVDNGEVEKMIKPFIKNCKNDNSIFNTRDYMLVEDVKKLLNLKANSLDSEWISVEGRLPTKDDADENN